MGHYGWWEARHMSDNQTGSKTEEPVGPLSGKKTPYYSFCFIALTIVFMNGWLLNAFIFPLYDGVYIWTREIATAVQGITMAAMAVLATWKPRLLSGRNLIACIAACLVFGALFAMVGLFSEEAVSLVLGSSLSSIGRSALIIFVGMSLLDLPPRALGICLAAACTASYAIRGLFAASIPPSLGMILYFGLPFAALVLSWKSGRAAADGIIEEDSPADLALSNPSSFLPFGHQLFICIILFRFTYGYGLTFGEEGRVPIFSLLAIVPLGIVLAATLVKKDELNPDRLFQLSFLLIFAGYLALSFEKDGAASVISVLINAGVGCFDILAWYILVSLGQKNRSGALAVLAWARP